MANGEKAVTEAEKEEDLMQYFESIEGGQRTKEADIAARQAEGRNKQIQKEALPNFDQTCVPTLVRWEEHVRKCKNDRAAGRDDIVQEVAAAAPAAFAKASYPLVLKMGLQSEEALELKGGRLFGLYKGRGSVDAKEAHRQILLSTSMSKK